MVVHVACTVTRLTRHSKHSSLHRGCNRACEQANDVRTWCTLSVHEMAHCSPVCARQTFTGTHEVVLPEGTLTSSPNDVGLLLGCSMSYSAYTQNVRVQHLMASVAKG